MLAAGAKHLRERQNGSTSHFGAKNSHGGRHRRSWAGHGKSGARRIPSRLDIGLPSPRCRSQYSAIEPLIETLAVVVCRGVFLLMLLLPLLFAVCVSDIRTQKRAPAN